MNESESAVRRGEGGLPGDAQRGAFGAVDKVFLGGCVALSVYLLAHLVAFRYGRDQGIYAVVADAMRRGGAPYRDAWDFKPPGVFFVYALSGAVLGNSEHAVRVLEALSWVSLVYAFCIFSRRMLGDFRPGLVGGALAILTHVQLEFWHTGQPESFGAVLIAWALVASTYEPSASDARGATKQLAAWAAAGVLYSAAALLKPPLGGGFLVSLGFVLARVRRRSPSLSWRTLAAPSLAFAIGGALPIVLTYAYFRAAGAFGDLYETLFVFTPHYTQLSFRSEWLLGFVFLAFEQWVFTFSAYNVFGFAFLLALGPLASREREGCSHVLGVVAIQLVGVALQAKFFPYHYGACLPLAGLLAGWGFWKLWLRSRRSMVGMFGMAALAYGLHDARTATRDVEDGFWSRCAMRIDALFDPASRIATDDRLYSVADVDAGANRRVAEWLAASVPPTSPVYVWGFEPVMYEQSKRMPATRYVYNVPQRVSWGRDEARARLMSDLRRAPPAAIVVEHRDVFPVVTGDNSDSADSLRGFTDLRTMIERDYAPAGRIEDFDLYLRAGSP